MEMTTTKATFPKYPEYKDSGVEWLGVIPEHWNLLSNKNIFKLKKDLVGKKSADYTLLSLTLKGIIQRDLDNGGKFPAEFDTYQEVKKGDFVFCLFDVEETPRCVGLSDFEGMITGAYTVMEVNPRFDKEFLYYFYLNLDADKRLRPLYTGLRNTISKDNFFAFKTFVPPKEEQTAIAAFLDDKTAKIDRAIAQKEQLIALLKERKQIVIQDAVTKGLNPNATMKHSGVEWIGEIPEHWEVKKVKYILRKSFSGGTPSTDKIEYWDGGIQWISSVDIKTDFLSKTSREISAIGLKRSSSNVAPKGSVVFVTRSGILQHTFALSILEKDMAINQDIKCLIFSEHVYQPYFLRLIQGNNSKVLVETRQQAATVESINMDAFFNLIIPIPPKQEQNAIVAHIETQSAKIEKAIALQEQQIEKLKELKATLIDSAVTGKIRVPLC